MLKVEVEVRRSGIRGCSTARGGATVLGVSFNRAENLVAASLQGHSRSAALK
jgi:hypothetical protein